MATKSDIAYMPLPAQSPLPALQNQPPTPELVQEQQIETMHKYLGYQLSTLRTASVLRSKPNTYYHKFLIPYLPQLLTSQRLKGLSDLRLAFVKISQALMNGTEERYQHTRRGLLRALDHAENAFCDNGENSELRAVNAIGKIFHLVTRLCNQEWGLENGSVHGDPIVDTSPEM